MKKALLACSAMLFVLITPMNSQGLLNKVKKAVTNEVLGTSDAKNSSKPGPEPSCACDDGMVIVDLSQFNIDYREMAISANDDGSILIRDRLAGKAYIAKDGKTQGPFDDEDSRVKAFENASAVSDNAIGSDLWLMRYPAFIKKSGDKYAISIGGSTYGPYAVISDFAVSQVNGSFAAIVTKEVFATEDMNRNLEAEMAKAKTDQEKMDIAMKYSQQMSNRMIQNGAGGESFQPELVSNVPGAKYDVMTWMGGTLNSRAKFGEIVVRTPTKVIDLKGNTLVNLSSGQSASGDLFISASNDKYAFYNYGTLTFSDKKTMTDLFSPAFSGSGGSANLTYMYYSPGRNAVIQCSLPF